MSAAVSQMCRQMIENVVRRSSLEEPAPKRARVRCEDTEIEAIVGFCESPGVLVIGVCESSLVLACSVGMDKLCDPSRQARAFAERYHPVPVNATDAEKNAIALRAADLAIATDEYNRPIDMMIMINKLMAALTGSEEERSMCVSSGKRFHRDGYIVYVAKASAIPQAVFASFKFDHSVIMKHLKERACEMQSLHMDDMIEVVVVTV